MWLWTGLACHAWFFATITKAAYASALFVAQAACLALAAWRRTVRFGFDGGVAAWTGLTFIFYAAVLYRDLSHASASGPALQESHFSWEGL